MLPVNATGRPALDWVGVDIHEQLTWGLLGFSRVEPLDLRDLVERTGQPPARLTVREPAALAALGTRLGADLVIGGAYVDEGGVVRIELVVVEVATQQTAARVVVGAPAERVGAAVRRALADIRAVFSDSRGDGPFLPSGPPESAEARAALARGLAAGADAARGGGQASLSAAVVALREAHRQAPESAETTYRLGEALGRAGEYGEARRVLERAVEASRAGTGATVELAAEVQSGEIALLEGAADEAQRAFEAAQLVARRARDPRAEAAILRGLGAVAHQRGDHAGARARLEEALGRWRALGHRRGEARALNHLGVLDIIGGEYERARRRFREAIDVAAAIGDRSTERAARNNLAVIALRQGAYREAAAAFEATLGLARATGDRWAEANALKNLGLFAATTGAYARAEPLLDQALGLARALGARLVEIDVLENLGSLRLAQRRNADAEAAYTEALGLARRQGIVLLEGRMLHHLGRVAHARGALGEAEARQRAALAIARRIGDLRLAAFALGGLGEVHVARREHAAGLARFGEAADAGRRLGAAEIVWRAVYGMGLVSEAEGAEDAALARYREAVGIIGDLARQFGEEDERQAFLGDRLAVYDALARALLRLHQRHPERGYADEAWAVLEARKGRLAAEALSGARAALASPRVRGALDPVQAAEDRAQAAELALRGERARPGTQQRAERIAELTRVLATTKREYLIQVREFLARYPQYKTLFVDQHAVDTRELAAFSERMPAGTLAVQYYAAPDRLYVFVVSRGRHQVKTREVDRAELYGLIREYRRYIVRGAGQRLPWADDGSVAYREDVAPLKRLTGMLAAHLLEPIAGELATHVDVVFMPNDLLFSLPIHALTLGGPDGTSRFLAETHAVSYLIRQHQADLTAPNLGAANRPLLALANPDGTLPGATLEVLALAAIRPNVTALVGPRATKEEFKRLARDFPQLHLATHGVLDAERPERSYLLLAGADDDSRRLDVTEIGALELESEVAVLSACETALGEQTPGAALITLAGAFSQAGARAIVASLWPVDDTATRDFMVAFHLALAADGRATALRRAQQAVRRDPSTTHPFYWASFILIGGR